MLNVAEYKPVIYFSVLHFSLTRIIALLYSVCYRTKIVKAFYNENNPLRCMVVCTVGIFIPVNRLPKFMHGDVIICTTEMKMSKTLKLQR